MANCIWFVETNKDQIFSKKLLPNTNITFVDKKGNYDKVEVSLFYFFEDK